LNILSKNPTPALGQLLLIMLKGYFYNRKYPNSTKNFL
jgi:hypothetical protein